MATEQESWSGGRQSSQIRHRWQRDWSALQNDQFLAPPRRLRRRIIFLFVLFLGLFAGFVYALLYTPDKTPLVMIAATEYQWPTPINAWAQEDADGFAELDARNLSVMDISPSWQTKAQGLGELQRRLERLGTNRPPQDAIVVYFSMHGAVNAAGEPCLIPPGVSHPQSSQWLPIHQVIATLNESLGTDAKKLLILDSQRVGVNWRLGILHNEFVDRLAEFVSQEKHKNLRILTAASTGETSWGSRDIQGSIFGKHVKLGLAGAADLRGSGNGDGHVTVHELHRYVRAQTLRWVRADRAATQTPRLLPPEAKDMGVTWAINRRSLSRLIESAASTNKPSDSVPAEDITQLWQKLERVRNAKTLAYDPLGLHRLEHQLLELEQQATGGRGYAKSAAALAQQLQRKFSEIEARQNANQDSASGVAWANLISGDDKLTIFADSLHSLGTSEYFSGLKPQTVRTFRERLLELASAPDEQELDALLNEFREKNVLTNLAETQLLRMACRYQVSELWSAGTPVRSVLEARVKAEQLSGLGDPRAQRWIRASLSQSDMELRLAEDAMFAGEVAATPGWEQLLETLDNLREATDSPYTLTAKALEVRDQAAAQLPYLARWFCRPLPADVSREQQIEAAQLIDGPLFDAVAATGELSDLLGNQPPQASSALPFIEQTDRTEDAMAALRQAFDETRDQLLDPKNQDVATLRDIEEALKVPTIPWSKRLTLLQKRVSIASALYDTPIDSDASDSAKADPDAANEGTSSASATSNTVYSERIRSWKLHPLLAILRLATVDPDGNQDGTDSKSLARIEESVRHRFNHLTDHAEVEPDAAEPPSGSARDALSARERAARASAAIWLPTSEGDPIANLRRFDWQDLLLHQCQRSLDDFWGPLQSPEQSAPSEPFFSIAATGYLDAAETAMPLRGEMEQRAANLRRLLSQRRLASRRGLQVSAEVKIQLEDNQGLAVDVTVSAGNPNATNSPGSTLVPGLVTLFARSPRGNVAGARSVIRLPLAESEQRQTLRGNSTNGAGRVYEAVAFLRGHEFSTPFLMEGIGGTGIEYQPGARSPTQLTVFGDRRKRSSIMFVLDCSSSMGDLIPVESIGGSTQPRLDLAESALGALMGELAQRTDTRVGVRFYGHRIGWTRTEPVQALAQQDYSGEIPDDLSPSEDVELVLPLGRFDSVQAGRVIQRMESLKAWGQSPSYLALLRCLDDFEDEDSDTDKSIVVITDGINYQFTPSGAPQNTAAPTTQQDVLRAWDDRDIPVYILGFGVSDEEASQAEREYRTLAEETGGEYYPVNNGRDLLNALRNRLSLGGYAVDDAQGRIVSPTSDVEPLVKLNTPVRLPVADGETSYTVKFESLEKQVTVTGGEALELYISDNGTDLVAKPFDENFPVAGLLSRRGERERFVLRAHRPSNNESEVTFPISIQSESLHFTRRPEDMWIEITPIVENATVAPPVYRFYDTNFVPQQPVPLQNWTASNWPTGAREATIRAWAKFSPTEPIQTIAVKQVLENRASYGVLQQVNGVPGVQYRIDVRNGGQELKIVEQHDTNSPGVYSVKVKLLTTLGLQPKRVVHQFDADNGLAIHTYFFSPEAAATLADSTTTSLAFYTRDSLQQDAWALEGGPLTVQVYGSGDTLPLNAATGPR